MAKLILITLIFHLLPPPVSVMLPFPSLWLMTTQDAGEVKDMVARKNQTKKVRQWSILARKHCDTPLGFQCWGREGHTQR